MSLESFPKWIQKRVRRKSTKSTSAKIVGNAIYGQVFCEPDWHSINIPMWEEHLSQLLDYHGRIDALEIGSFEGRSAIWIQRNMLRYRDSTLTCVDPWDAQDKVLANRAKEAERIFDLNMVPFADKLRKVKSDSLTALCREVMSGRFYDFIYVDGCHEGSVALTDLLLCWQLLKEGGFLVMDDYQWSSDLLRAQPKDAYNAFISVRPSGLRVIHIHRQVILRKILTD